MGHEFEPLSGQIIEAAIDVHKELGPGVPRVGLRKRRESRLATPRHRL
jgi:hypothetical protein